MVQIAGLLADGVDALAELGLGPTFLGRQVEQVALLAVERFKSFFILLTEVIGKPAIGGDGCVHTRAYGVQPIGVEHQRVAVVAGDGFFEHVDRDVRHVAKALLTATTEPIEVFAAVADRTLHDEAVLATRAVERAFEVVIMRSLPRTGAAVRVKDALDAVEALRLDQ